MSKAPSLVLSPCTVAAARPFKAHAQPASSLKPLPLNARRSPRTGPGGPAASLPPAGEMSPTESEANMAASSEAATEKPEEACEELTSKQSGPLAGVQAALSSLIAAELPPDAASPSLSPTPPPPAEQPAPAPVPAPQQPEAESAQRWNETFQVSSRLIAQASRLPASLLRVSVFAFAHTRPHSPS